jgi:hypothetical protein
VLPLVVGHGHYEWVGPVVQKHFLVPHTAGILLASLANLKVRSRTVDRLQPCFRKNPTWLREPR